MDLFRQLGDLFLQAVPTVIIVFLFYYFLRWAFFGPIQKAMAQRSAQIEGARAEALAAEAAAKQDLDAYNEALKKARAQIYLEQEAARQTALDERAKLLRAMRARAQEDVGNGKKRIEAEAAAAREQVALQTPVLAGEIARRILDRSPSSRGGAAR